MASVLGMFFITGWKINEILDLTLDQFMFIGESNFKFLSSLFSYGEKTPSSKNKMKVKFGKGKQGKVRNLTPREAQSYIEDE